MNIKHLPTIAFELNALPEEERDELGMALERIVGFLDRIGLGQHDVVVRDLTLPMDIGGGRWERHLEFKALVKRCGVRKFKGGIDQPNYWKIPKVDRTDHGKRNK